MHDLPQLARWIGIGVGVLALALIAYQYVLFRRRLPLTTREKLLTLAGIGLLPFLTLTISQSVAYERMQTVEFCRSCHVMEPHAADLRDPKSETLAARHAINHRVNPEKACYVCHSTYAMLGPVQDKIRGLRHLHAFYFKKGGREIKMYEPFENHTCLHCHGGAKQYEEHPAHAAVMEQIKAEEMSCLTCHGEAHPEAARKIP